ncbi:FAD-dependent oxidoreductase [Nocardioides astragali]|uniref:FAD-dependent oxidoreductase n=1 Tax=Nocardioides astragali TaxID=1776736 RepID=A0ABW2N201_9ACTN|nr:NAD(P)/FAD-dependent oxidoreductase [Nocardioides astragali]
MATQPFDVVVAGGGLAGASVGGVLARSGLGVLVVEKERVFRDRIRGELTWPWGHHEALRAGLGEALVQAGAVNRPALDFYADGQRVDSLRWADVSIDALPAIAFSHPLLQETLLTWAEAQGATVMRPAKVAAVQDGHRPVVTIIANGRTTEVRARLIVGADGKKSGARRWLGAETVTDAEHHWFGGLLLSGVPWDDTFGWATTPAAAVGWFATSSDSCRVYIRLRADQVRAAGIAHSVDKFVDFAAKFMPSGTMDGARKTGPLGFFPNSCTWSSRTALGHAVLVGDAAGALDPTQGLGTSLLFRDVRGLSELLADNGNWERATSEFAYQRHAYYGVLRAYDRWCALLDAEEGPEADRRRELNAAAREADPTLGGFAMLEACGPDGLVPDEEARRIYFGE